MSAATLSIGDELALGQIDDTNARWIAERLAALGLFRAEHRTVGDDRAAIADAMAALASRASLVVATGGLGPTADDLTRDALNDLTDGGAALVEDAEARAALDRWFRGRGRAMPLSNLVQATRPRSARTLANEQGTAPGLLATVGRATIVCLPGPPREMQPMFERAVVPVARAIAGGRTMPTETVHAFGLGESALAERIEALMRRTDREEGPLVGTTASRSIVSARIRGEGPEEEARAAVDATAREIERAWWPYAYGRGATTLAAAAVARLVEREETVAVAESCTGGLLGAMLTSVPGSSRAVAGGVIAYSNDLKERLLGVPRSMLAAHGAVSEAVAAELARGARSAATTTWALGITGIAGPDGGTTAKPVGTVFIGLASPAGVVVRRFHFPGERDVVRDRAAKSALQWLRCATLGEPEAPFLWAFADAPAAERERGGR